MNSPEQALGRRIKELRRRHFGPQGKELFAQRLGLSVEEYTRFERGVVPPGEVMVRMCEATGEDLQWLLTGVAARGTVVISGTRGRHQDLLARLARLLDDRPELAAPVEAFVDLLARGAPTPSEKVPALPGPKLEHLIPILEPNELPSVLPDSGDGTSGSFDLACFTDPTHPVERERVEFAEPAMRYESDAFRPTELLTLQRADGSTHRCVHCAEIADCFPNAFGVRLVDDSMKPMFSAGDAVLVAAGAEPKVGRPVLCRVADERGARCRIWLGDDGGVVHLGRLADGECEQITSDEVRWSLEVLFRLGRAA